MERPAPAPPDRRGYFLAGLVTAAGIAAGVLLRVSASAAGIELLPLLPAVLAATLISGTGPGLAAALCCLVAVCVDVVLPRSGVSAVETHPQLWLLGAFTVCAALTVLIAALASRGGTLARQRARALEDQARTDAADAARRQEQMLGQISHELRTPLTAILGWVQVMRAQAPPAQLAHGLEVVERNTRTLARIVEEQIDARRESRGGGAGSSAAQPAAAAAEPVVPGPSTAPTPRSPPP